MRRLRLLRLLVPALLVPFVFLIAIQIRPRPGTTTARPAAQATAGPRVESLEFSDLLGEDRRYSLEARVGRMDQDGTLHLEGIDELSIERDDAPPLVVRAERGEVAGAPGNRRIRLEGGVRIHDEAEGLFVSLPTLIFDEDGGEARSEGEVHMEDAVSRGTAASVVYGLEDQPTVLVDVTIESKDGSTLAARTALLHDGIRDVEMRGDVRITRGESLLDADSVHLWRDDEGRFEHALATGRVAAIDRRESPPVRLDADRAEVWWGDDGEISLLTTRGDARLHQGEGALTAARLDLARRREETGGWDLTAAGSASATTIAVRGRLTLTADTLEGFLDAEGTLRRGVATGDVLFEGPDSRAEAVRATFRKDRLPAPVILESEPGQKARIATGRTRVAASRIETHPDGSYLEAVDGVEATLLPKTVADRDATATAFFRHDEVVHFVAERLVSREEGNRLTFTANVRGWQGDRNLSANRVDLDQSGETLLAEGNVNTRFPRVQGDAGTEIEFIQVSSARLDYSGPDARAVYVGKVRARQAEGWMECGRLEVDILAEGGGAEELRAFDSVRFEFRSPDGVESPPATGEGDRLVYRPDDHTVVLYGDEAPAVVRRDTEDGGVSTGRVLRYRLDTGTLDVESGERDRARIRSSES